MDSDDWEFPQISFLGSQIFVPGICRKLCTLFRGHPVIYNHLYCELNTCQSVEEIVLSVSCNTNCYKFNQNKMKPKTVTPFKRHRITTKHNEA